MRCKLLLQHYARYQEQPTTRLVSWWVAIAKSAELVKGVILKRKLCQIEITQIQKSISSHFANNPHRLKKNMQILLRQILKVKDCLHHQRLDIHTEPCWTSSHQFWCYQTTSTPRRWGRS